MKISYFISMVSVWAMIVAAFAVAPLDEGVWPVVVPEFKTPSARTVKGAYFRGRVIRSSEEVKKGCAYRFRRTCSFKMKPAEGWVQFIGIGAAELKLNDKSIAQNSYWPKPTVKEVSKYLKAGDNAIEFICKSSSISSGVLAELFVRYPDGTHERIDTDSSFRVSQDEGETWSNVIEQMPPPANPWRVIHRLAYVDFAHPQQFIEGTVKPNKTVSGKKVMVQFDFNGLIPGLPLDIGIEIRKKDSLYWREDIVIDRECIKPGTNGNWTICFPFNLPQYLSGGTYDIVVAYGLSCISGNVAKASFSCCQANISEKFKKPPLADVRMVAGAPQFHLDGKPFFALWGGLLPGMRPDRRVRHSSAPLTVVTVFSRGDNFWNDEWWPSEHQFNPAVFDRQAERARRENGDDAYFMWDFALYPPQDWIKAHPDDMCMDDKGALITQGRPAFSFASKSALDAMESALIKALRYLESAPYANRIIGYRINSGHFTEWIGWFPKPGRFVDFSPVAKKAFAEYVNKNHPEWSNTAVPSAEDRISNDPMSRARCAAYHDFYSRQIGNDIIRLMSKAREIVGKGKLLGTYYGYLMTANLRGDGQMRGHYALKRVLNAGVVDFLMSPQNYAERRLGGICCDMKPFATLAANCVVPIIENDARTSNGPYNGNNQQTLTRMQDMGIVRRDAGISLCRRSPVFFYALCEGTEFDFPEFADDMSVIRKVAEHCLMNATGRHAEVAYVVSENAIKASQPLPKKAYATGGARQCYNPDGSVRKEKVWCSGFADVFQFNYTTLARAGASVDYILAEDLDKGQKEYKLYIEPDIINGKMRFRAKTGVSEGDTFLNLDTLRDLYAKTGIHIYSRTGDPIEANDRLFTLHARFAGLKTVTLPLKTTVLDVFNRRIVAKDTDTFTFDAPIHSSWLFYYGDDAEVLAAELNH